MSKHLSNYTANFSKKTFTKSKYLVRTVIFLDSKAVIWASWVEYINILDISQAICTIKALTFLSNGALAKFFLLIILARQVVDRALAVV